MKILNDPARGADYRQRRRARWWKMYQKQKAKGVKMRGPKHIISMPNRSYKHYDHA